MKKALLPEVRVISVDHDRTTLAAQRLRHCMDRHDLQKIPVCNVFCHLESGRCGLSAGVVGVEVDGVIIWTGEELTEELAGQFCAGLRRYMEKA